MVEPTEEELEGRKRFVDKNLPVKEFKTKGNIEEGKHQNKNVETTPKEEEDDDGCPVCLSGYQDGDEVSWSTNTACEHLFHKDCIHAWLLKHYDCPMCRNAFLPEEEEESGGDEIVSAAGTSNATSADSDDPMAEGRNPA
jgi:hypothetical protein